MDQMTQQNAAMVEQSTAASQALANDAGELTQLISRFRVAGAEVRNTPARRPAAPPPRMARPQSRPQTHGSAALKLAPQAQADTWEEF
jgi:methyl-accepting chemotaxis protein